MTRNRYKRASCIRCNAQSDTAAMLPLFSTRSADETPALFIHTVCAQAFVVDQLNGVARTICAAKRAGSASVTELGEVRALKDLEQIVDRSIEALEATHWSP